MSTADIFVLILVGALALALAAAAAHRLVRAPRGDAASGLAWRLVRVYSSGVHRLRVRGREHVPRGPRTNDAPGPLVIVANHTAGIDPILLQAALPFFVRFVMAEDMKHPLVNPFLGFVEVIFVDRKTGEARGVRDAIEHLRAGGVIGLFPEGGLERPPEMLRPFGAGVGLLIRRSGARVLPVIIRGTPRSESAWGSLNQRSQSELEFLPVVSYAGTKLSAAQIAADLRGRFQAATGWPLNDA